MRGKRRRSERLAKAVAALRPRYFHTQALEAADIEGLISQQRLFQEPKRVSKVGRPALGTRVPNRSLPPLFDRTTSAQRHYGAGLLRDTLRQQHLLQAPTCILQDGRQAQAV